MICPNLKDTMNHEFSSSAADFPDPFRLLIRDECASTNDELRTLANQGAGHGLVLLTKRQTAGRGRRGAAWFSPSGDSLAFTILLRPQSPKSNWPRLALAAGLAVAEAIAECGVEAGIKWPNDVWVHGRKIAGILVEAGEDFVLVGMGININNVDFPAEVSDIATSICLATGQQHDRAGVLAAVVRHFAARSAEIDAHFPILLSSVRSRCVLTGREVRLSTAQGPLRGKVIGISPVGELMLETPEGIRALLQADEIRLI